MNVRQHALVALNALRAADARLPDTSDPKNTVAIWTDLAESFPHGADVAPDVAKMVGRIVSGIDRALSDPFTVRIDRESSVIVGLIICPDSSTTKITPLAIRESVVTLDGVPFFVGRARGREALRLAILACVIKQIEAAE